MKAQYGYTYKLFTYQPEHELDSDNIKTYHWVKYPGGFMQINTSPYRTPSEEEFNMWVESVLNCLNVGG